MSMTEEVFSPPQFTEGEVSPASNGIPSASLNKRIEHQCPECGETFGGMIKSAAAASLSRHRKAKHREEWDKDRDVKPGQKPKPRVERSTERPPASKTTEPTTRRKPGTELLTMVADGAGSLIAMTGIPSTPMGLALKLEASLLGPAGDKAIANTFLDKTLLQPALKAKGKFDEIGPLVMFPILIGICDKQPALRTQLYPVLRMCMAPLLPDLVSSFKAAKVVDQKLQQAAADLSELDETFAQIFADGGDPIDALLDTLFPTAPETEAEPDGDS